MTRTVAIVIVGWLSCLLPLGTANAAQNDEPYVEILPTQNDRFRVISHPPAARVYRGGKMAGITPILIDVSGEHGPVPLLIYQPGFFAVYDTIPAEGRSSYQQFEKLALCGILMIPELRGAETLLVGNRMVSMGSPFTSYLARRDSSWAVIDQLPLGEHQVFLEKPGHVPYEFTVIIDSVRNRVAVPPIPLERIHSDLTITTDHINARNTIRSKDDERWKQVLTFASDSSTNVTLFYGSYFLCAEADGYQPFLQEFRIEDVEPQQLHISFNLPDPGITLRRSLIFPGAGHLYERRVKTGRRLFYTGLLSAGVAIASTILYNIEYDEYQELWETLENHPAQFSSTVVGLNEKQRTLSKIGLTFIVSSTVYLGSYVYGLIDIIRLKRKHD